MRFRHSVNEAVQRVTLLYRQRTIKHCLKIYRPNVSTYFIYLCSCVVVNLESVSYGPEVLTGGDFSYDGHGLLSIVDSTSGFPASGILQEWRFYATRTGTLHLHAWRKQTNTDTFLLVGQISVEVTSTGEQSVLSSDFGVIDVQEGDLLGLYSPGELVIPFVKSTCPGGQVYQIQSPPDLSTGAVYEPTAVPSNTDNPCRQYSLAITILSGKSYVAYISHAVYKGLIR